MTDYFTKTPSFADVQTYAALSRLMRGYARGVDRVDAALLAQVFHPDADVITGVVNGKGADFPKLITDFVRANNERTSHAVVSEWFEVDGDQAKGESYVISVSTAGGEQSLVGGRYLNHFIHEDGRWWISRHVFVLDSVAQAPAPESMGGIFQVMKHLGQFGKADPVYQSWGEQ